MPLAEKEKLEEAQRLEKENKNRQLCPVPAKKEPLDVDLKTEKDDDLYNMPIKQYLKRKYEESVVQKSNLQIPELKRMKPNESNNDDNNDESNDNVLDENDDSDGPPEELPSCSKRLPQKPLDKNRSNQKIKRNKYKSNLMSNQSSNKPVQTNFNYQKVDFKKFQGGAKRAKGMEIKPQVHGKVNNIIFYKLQETNKPTTY